MSKVTIITSLYKGGKYISGFLHDISRQTIFEDCSLYILDANSPDNEYEVICDYQKKFKNIRYERFDHQIGIYPAWNYMIRNSQSEYITNANVDDKLFKNSIEKHVEVLDASNDIDVAYCLNVCTNSPDTSEDDLTGDEPIFPTADFSIQNIKSLNAPHNHPVWRRSIHKKNGYFDEGFKSGSDWEFWIKCAMNNSKMFLIKEKLGIYYRNPEGMSTKKENMFNNLLEIQVIKNRYDIS